MSEGNALLVEREILNRRERQALAKLCGKERADGKLRPSEKRRLQELLDKLRRAQTREGM